MADQPNILHISWHDVGRFIGCYGVGELHTPCVDALAADGVLFENYWATSSVCSPSRACAMTGRYPQSNGCVGLAHRPQRYSIGSSEKHVSRLLRDAGYHTALIGWQHETTHDRVQERLAFEEVHCNDPMPTCDVIAPFAAKWLQRWDGSERFYLQVGFQEVHRPHTTGGVEPDSEHGIHVPPWLVDNETARCQLAQQQGMIRKADEHVGVVLDALARSGLERDTLVVFTSDHGIAFPRAKTTLYDPGVGIPLVMRWPGGGIEGGRRCDRLLSNVDFVPTLLELLDLPAPANLQGRSFAGALAGDDPERPPREQVFALFLDEIRMVRTERYKLLWNIGPRKWTPAPANVAGPEQKWHWPVWELYDLEADPLETTNRVADPALSDVKATLRDALWNWMESVEDPLLKGPEETPYYRRAHADYRQRRGD